MQLFRLLWDPLPDVLPSADRRRFSWLRDLVSEISRASTPLSEQEKVDRRVRRGAVQALVQEAYRATVAEQDEEHRAPASFSQAWQAHLAGLLDQPSVDLDGWGPIEVTQADISLAWSLYELASRARHDAIQRAAASPSRPAWRGQQVPTFEFSIISDGDALGDVAYGVCQPCRVGLLYKIEFSPDWQFCGFGRLALSQLEGRHPDLTWFTTGQFSHAKGFYDRYRQDSISPWTTDQHPCPHFYR